MRGAPPHAAERATPPIFRVIRDDDLHGLSDEYLIGYVNRIYSVTPEDVQRIAQDYLRDEDMLLVVVGDRSSGCVF